MPRIVPPITEEAMAGVGATVWDPNNNRLVRPHQPAVAGDIGGQDGSQLALDALGRHGGIPFLRQQLNRIGRFGIRAGGRR
jgi:hypothetical protein